MRKTYSAFWLKIDRIIESWRRANSNHYPSDGKLLMFRSLAEPAGGGGRGPWPDLTDTPPDVATSSGWSSGAKLSSHVG